ncbi:class I SAM-dependent methyltransferase [Brevibacillus fulvus]|uniref:Ubiquinone/menaquinone biosynthesis C-methylase UbiE n=1 Tax=Brevibacillus fulvus TaxID=1125967 RepID=A0A938Y263_9BACL|nr:class I SAM-dependent methyltransferase [Brevibacillus fulvus]MBM7589825.1 ubiquinone/menaquinone biosynthesis C-methylase UbiE [Brevibacillus fulvus]
MSANNMYRWADYYDLTQRGVPGDVEFFLELAKAAGGDILELACGTGRITIPMAEAGLSVTGLDLSGDMLQKAKQKAAERGVLEQVHFLQGDMRKFALDQQFSLIMIPYRSFLHLLHIQEQMKALACIRRHLTPGGKLALNVFVPHIAHLYEEAEKMTFRGSYRLESGEEIAMWDYTRYDHFQQLAEITRTYERISPEGVVTEKVVGRFTLRYIFPAELHHLLRLNGFKIVERYGSFDRKPFDAKSTELIIIAEAL